MSNKMLAYCSYCVLVVLIFSGITEVSSQVMSHLSSSESAAPIKTLELADTLDGGLFLLIPSHLNLTDFLSNKDSDFSLFKLNTDALLANGGRTRKRRSTGKTAASKQSTENGRTNRKINLFRNLFNKPKYSQLFLVNGTVCRFINSSPVCTTISTNGLPVSLNGVVYNNAIADRISGLNQFGNQQPFQQQPQQQFQNQGQFNNNNPQQQQLNNNQPGFNTNPQLRPAGLMDDESPSINVSNLNNITSGSGSAGFKMRQQPSATLSASDHGSRYGSQLKSFSPMRQLISGPSISLNNLQNKIGIRGGRKGD